MQKKKAAELRMITNQRSRADFDFDFDILIFFYTHSIFRMQDRGRAPPPPPLATVHLGTVKVMWTNYTSLERKFIGD